MIFYIEMTSSISIDEQYQEALAYLKANEEVSKALPKEPKPSPCNESQVGNITYLALPFKSAKDFVNFFDPALRSGKKKLHKWQEEILDEISQKGKYTIQDRLRFLLRAANGSGKDWAIIGGFVSFVLCCWRRYKIVVTSASHRQLDTQTRVYIEYLCENVNSFLKEQGVVDEDVIDIKKEEYTSKIFEKPDGSKYTLTGSVCITFVTDDPGLAEGHHPLPDADPGEGVIIILNEAKTISDEVFKAFARCTFNYWIAVSSPGQMSGRFYRNSCDAVPWEIGHIKGRYLERKITSYDCPHIDPDSIELDKKEAGENSAWFKSKHLAEFTNIDQKTVISEDAVKKCLKRDKIKIDIGQPRRAGLDLAGGGAENALYVYDNNILIGKEIWRIRDTEITVDLLAGTEEDPGSGYFAKYKLRPENIYGDDNGLGQAIIDGLAKRRVSKDSTETWSIVRIRNQFKPLDSTRYRNRGAELWFRFARLVEEGIVDLDPNDLELHQQLWNRHYKQAQGTGQFQLLSKEEELLEGNKSPDRADALVLAFTGLTIMDFLNKDAKKVAVAQNYPTQAALVQQLLKSQREAPRFFFEPHNIKDNRAAALNPVNLQHYLYASY